MAGPLKGLSQKYPRQVFPKNVHDWPFKNSFPPDDARLRGDEDDVDWLGVLVFSRHHVHNHLVEPEEEKKKNLEMCAAMGILLINLVYNHLVAHRNKIKLRNVRGNGRFVKVYNHLNPLEEHKRNNKKCVRQ